MKGESFIGFGSRKNASFVNADFPKNKKVINESELTERAFIPRKEVSFEPIKIQKKTPLPPRKSSRLATKDLKQTVLVLQNDTTISKKESISKRKIEELKKSTNKKQKTIHNTLLIEKESHPLKEAFDKNEEKKVAIEEVSVAKEKKESIETVETKTIENQSKQSSTEAVDTIAKEEVTVETKETVVIEPEQPKNIIEETLPLKESITSPLPQPQPEDSPSPPSTLSLFNDEPATPPSLSAAPYKEYLTPADKQRIIYEKTTLQKVRKALDIVITDRAARNRPTLYHQIEPVLRNSTQRTITLSHICKVMYLVPSLYTLEAKELRNFGGKVTEAFLIEFGKDWIVPLNGKDLQKRADLLTQSVEHYFEIHRQPDASVPEIPLPRLALVVDKKEWIKDAKLPPGVKSLLQAHEKAKEADKEKEKPKPKPTGTVKDRMAALRARLAEKKAS